MCKGPERSWSKALKGLPVRCGWGSQSKGQNGGGGGAGLETHHGLSWQYAWVFTPRAPGSWE